MPSVLPRWATATLLGRTYFVIGDLLRANAVRAREAVTGITDVTSKDYADLQIPGSAICAGCGARYADAAVQLLQRRH